MTTKRTLEERLNHLEEAMMEQSVVQAIMMDKQDIDLDAMLLQLFTVPKNIEIIKKGLKDPHDLEVLQRVINNQMKLKPEEPSLIIQAGALTPQRKTR